MNLKDLVRQEVQNLKPYQILDFPCSVRLDANECPYNLPPEIKHLLGQEVNTLSFNRYPCSIGKELRADISSFLGVNKDMVILGNGSDELIFYLLLTVNCEQVVYPIPTFAMYGILGQIVRVKSAEVPLNEGFELDEKSILEMADSAHSIIFLSYPNNPTGNCFSKERMIRILENTSCLVVVDEAYYEFSQKSFLPLLERYKNLAVLRTFSKIGLAGLRVGYLVGQPELVSQLFRVKLPYNLNTFSQAAAKIMLQNRNLLKPQIERIVQEREKMYLVLKDLKAISVYPSEANFILFRSENIEGQTLFEYLVKAGVLIRNLSSNSLLKNCLRVTIGTEEENKIFISKLKELLK